MLLQLTDHMSVVRALQIYSLKPNSIMLAGSELRSWFGVVRSWFEQKFGLSSSLLAANSHELAGQRPDSITLSGSNLVRMVRSWFEPDSVMEFGFYCLKNKAIGYHS